MKPTQFSGALDCPGVRKMVRYPVMSGPFTVQVSGPSIALLVSVVPLTSESDGHP